jgi:S-methylmethionine-dependent homocysteine/selenocysteine methylase
VSAVTVLDGPMGTELARRGVATPAPGWSAPALVTAPDVVAGIHRDYAAAGATVHRANTFRTTRRRMGESWEDLARVAVALARSSVPASHRVAGSLGPLEDCYRPDLSPGAASRAEHAELARVLAGAGVDLIVCETFPAEEEAVAAVEAAVATRKETWVALTAGPAGDLMSPARLANAARACLARGARAAFVNCVAARKTLPFVEALAHLGAPVGVYANAWQGDPPPDRYAEMARTWIDAGASILGACCGAGPEHVAAIASSYGPTPFTSTRP